MALKQLKKNLKYDTYTRLFPDAHGGVGVFAIKDIPKGANPFKINNAPCMPHKIVDVPDSFVQTLDSNVKKIISDFYVLENGKWGIPKPGINANDITFYLNYSQTPNLKITNSKKCNMVIFKTLKNIPKGEELLINYDVYYKN